ncbi:Wzz/FepE/Etk N-terminal domain-containing protein [Mycoplasmatota bacterium WC30]
MNELNQQQIIEDEGMTLQELFKIVWLNKALIILVTLWVMVIGIVYTYVLVTPTYTAETSLIVQVDVESSGGSEASGISVAQNLIGTYKEFVVSNKVLESVVEDVDGLADGYSISGLRNNISISTTSGVLIIRIKVENEDPVLAAEIANQLVTNSINIANDVDDEYLLLQNKLKVLDVAKTPVNPTSPNKLLNVVISILLGGIISLAIVFVKELFNNKFQSVNEMEKLLGIKVIAAVPGTMKERKLVE